MQTNPSPQKDRKLPFLKVVDENADHAQAENDFFEEEKEENPLDSFLKMAESGPAELKEKDPPGNQDNPFMSSFLVELIYTIKKTLISIKNTSTLSADRFNDVEFRKLAQKSVIEEIKTIDSVLNSLLNYININTPIIKSNTISNILEEVLEANKKQIEGKRIKIFRKNEKDLPETFIHDEQMRFVLNSVLQYALLCVPLGGTIGFLIKSFNFNNGGAGKQVSSERNGGYIEAAIGFIGESSDLPKNGGRGLAVHEQGTANLILQLVKEILQNNHGGMTYEFDPKKPRTLITLRFPIERRKVLYYEPVSI